VEGGSGHPTKHNSHKHAQENILHALGVAELMVMRERKKRDIHVGCVCVCACACACACMNAHVCV